MVRSIFIVAGLLLAFCVAQASAAASGLIDVSMQVVSLQEHQNSWPFTTDAGTLACMRGLGEKVVIFLPDPKLALDEEAAVSDFADDKYVLVTANPISLYADVGKANLLKAGLSIEDKIKLLGPFVTLGKKLCDQPKGTVIGPSEQ